VCGVVQVIEPHWCELQEGLRERVKNVDDVIKLHQEFQVMMMMMIMMMMVMMMMTGHMFGIVTKPHRR
jgi:hypothetical protein